jgi:CRP/FNR family transcriptional regulator
MATRGQELNVAIALAVNIPADEAKISKAVTALASGAMECSGHMRALPVMPQAERTASELDRAGTVVSCLKGQTLVEEGHRAAYIFKVILGAFRTVRFLPDGRRHVASFHLPGEFIGLADDEFYGHSVEALADARLVRYTRTSFEATLELDPGAGRRLFALMRKELAAAQDRVLLLGRKTAAERLATFLLTLNDRKADNHAGADRTIELPMNRSDMADYLGLRIETVCRLLTDLKHRHIVNLPNIHSVIVLRRDLLEDESEGKA